MRVPAITGVIRRRILVNFRVDADAAQRQLPAPFRPKLLRGEAMVGICLIRLERLRPDCVALPIGISSESAAHRTAVCWTDADGREQEGVYVGRRDTNACISSLGGGRLFPGVYRPAAFQVQDDGDQVDFTMRSQDGRVAIYLRGRAGDGLPHTS